MGILIGNSVALLAAVVWLLALETLGHPRPFGYHHKHDLVRRLAQTVVTVYDPRLVTVFVDRNGRPVSTTYPASTPLSANLDVNLRPVGNNACTSATATATSAVVHVPFSAPTNSPPDSGSGIAGGVSPVSSANPRNGIVLSNVLDFQMQSQGTPASSATTNALVPIPQLSINSAHVPTVQILPPTTQTIATPSFIPTVAVSAASIAPPVVTSSTFSNASPTFEPSTSELPQISAAESIASSSASPSSSAQPKSPQSPPSTDFSTVIPGVGISYAPYLPDGGCKTESQIEMEISKIPKIFNYIRIYGTDCGQLNMIIPAASRAGLKVFTGIYYLNDDQTGNKKPSPVSFPGELSAMLDYGTKNGWDQFIAVAVGNEDLDTNRYPLETVLARMSETRTSLRQAGFNGPVVHVDTTNAFLSNPAACEASDFVGLNAHAWFSGLPPEQAGTFLKKEVQRAQEACPGKPVIITETGWPHNGIAHNRSVASRSEQEVAIDSIRVEFPNNLVLFSAYDDPWKKDNEATFGAERFWGLFPMPVL